MPNSNAFTLEEINQILDQLNTHPGARLVTPRMGSAG